MYIRSNENKNLLLAYGIVITHAPFTFTLRIKSEGQYTFLEKAIARMMI